MKCLPDATQSANPDDTAVQRAVEAAGLGTWEIDLATDRAVHHSRQHDSIFGHAAPVPDWGFAAAARQVIEEDRPAFLQAVEAARGTGILRQVTRIRLPDGAVRWIAMAGSLLPGAPLRMAGTVADVTGRFAGFVRLRDSELRLRLALDLSALGIAEWDIQAGTLFWSDEILRIFGRDRTQVAGTYAEWRDMVVPEDLIRIELHLRDAMERRAPRMPISYAIRRPDGAIRQIEGLVAFTYAPDGTPLFGIGVNRDTTEERLAVQALARSEARNRALFEQVAVGVVDIDATGCWLRANRRLAEMLGYGDPGELAGRHESAMIHPDDRIPGEHLVASLLAGRITHFARDLRLLRKDGGEIWVHSTVSLMRDGDPGAPPLRIAIVADATERKRAEIALADAQERLRIAQDAAGAGFWEIDPVRRLVTCSPVYARIRGLPEGTHVNMASREWLTHVHPDDRTLLVDALKAAFVSGTYELEFRLLLPDGTVRYLAGRGRTQFDAAGQPVRLIGMTMDVTALRENQLRLRMAMEGTGLATWDYVGANGAMVWSANHFALFGYPVDPAGRAPFAVWRDAVHPEDLPRLREAIAAAAQERPFRLLYRIRRADDGTERWMESLARVVGRDDAGRPQRLAGITLDVTERETARRKLEQQQAELLHISRLADAGVMASALVHELSQPLTAASSAMHGAQLFLSRAEPGAVSKPLNVVTTALGLAEGQITRAGRIVAGLREFVMPQARARLTEELRPLIDDARNLAVIGHHTPADRIALAVPPDLPAVLVDGVQVRQVLFNLLRNAIQAVEQRHPAPEARSIAVTAVAQKGMVEVTVTDNGPGLDQTVAERLFEPFTTSKADGMGIGLSICRSIVEAHGGRIQAEGSKDGGMTFRFTLPAVDRERLGGHADDP